MRAHLGKDALGDVSPDCRRALLRARRRSVDLAGGEQGLTTRHALADDGADDAALKTWLRDGSGVSAEFLEREINGAGYAIRENLGDRPALKVFTLNTALHPESANAWDSLAECHAALGDAATAASLYEKSRQLAEAAKAKP